MIRTGSLPEVGAPDPEHRNSPGFDDSADELSMDLELEEGQCFFADKRYALDAHVCSGGELLHCASRGIWIREGSCYRKS